MSVKVPSDLILIENERPYWYGRRSLKSLLIPFILSLMLLISGAIITIIGSTVSQTERMFITMLMIIPIVYFIIPIIIAIAITLRSVLILLLLMLLLLSIPSSSDILIVGVVFIIMAIVTILNIVLAIVSTEYFISSHRVYVKYGIIARRVFEIKNEWITTAAVRQGVIGRMFNYGDLLISVPGHYLGSVTMYGVSDPLHVKAIVDDTLRRFKEAQRIIEELKILEREYDYGRISKEKYEELKKKYEEELKKIL
jgi:hypothetical protein